MFNVTTRSKKNNMTTRIDNYSKDFHFIWCKLENHSTQVKVNAAQKFNKTNKKYRPRAFNYKYTPVLFI
jgi:hypothetical protein